MIGDKLSELLKVKKIKPGTLATLTGIPKSTIYSIIKRNNKNVDFSVMEKISDVLGVPVEYFYERPQSSHENEKNPAPESGLSEARRALLDAVEGMSEEEILHLLDVIAAVKGMRK